MAVSALLLAALLSALGLYLRAFDSGRTDVEQAQLARGLLARVSADLRALRPMVVAERPAASGTGVNLPRAAGRAGGVQTEPAVASSGKDKEDGEAEFVLRGGPRTLELELVADARASEPEEVTPVERPGTSPAPAVRWRRVRYAWLAREATAPALPEATPGSGRWMREELEEVPRRKGRGLVPSAALDRQRGRDVERSDPTAASLPADASIGQDTAQREVAEAEEAERWSTEDAPEASSERSELQEVAGWELRYFDGRAWRQNWDSVRERCLPQAIEIQLALWRGARGAAPAGVAAAVSPAGEGRSAEPEFFPPPADDAMGATAERVEDSRWIIYRQVVALPQAAGSPPRGGKPAGPARAVSAERGFETAPGGD